jgi:UDP-3-O-[3-hydroxymyristoyl] glucosamine N-acyltransferase
LPELAGEITIRANPQADRRSILEKPDFETRRLRRLRFPSVPFREERKSHVVATVEQLAALIHGRLVGDGTIAIRSARPVGEAGPGDITFIENERYAKYLRTSPASAAIVGPHFQRAEAASALATIEVDDPIQAFLAVRTHLLGAQRPRWVGIHPQSVVAASAKIGANVAIYPFVYVGEDTVIEDGATLLPGVVIGDGCRIGPDCLLHPNAVLYNDVSLGARVEIHSGTVLGGDGFGYRLIDGRHVKVPQTGRVEIGDDVEIGANCTVDRATFEVTRIGEGSKIDNLVMIGHNNQIGRHNLLCGQVGIAGSCKTGDYVVMAGQAGIKDNTEIGDRVVIGAQAGVHRNVPTGHQVLGSPAVPVREQRRIFQMIARLPEMHRQLRELTGQITQLSAYLPQAGDHENAPTDASSPCDRATTDESSR